ncbi:MobA/MobL family protein, partial [Psychrobacter aquimaris]|uniref:MobA/MobL family protein n=1 Tax=Psychrobacter aquimaris TaxID=292733 RepID=UPI003FD4C1BE
MAIFRAETKHISRGKGHNVVAAAAYRAGQKLTDTNKFNPDATTYDYSKKHGVLASGIILPKSLADQDFSIDRQTLWSSVEQSETTTRSVKGSRLKQKSRLAREWLLALPIELSDDENKELTREFTTKLVNDLGVIADYAIHKPTPFDIKPRKFIGDDEKRVPIAPDTRNVHAHIMFTTRKVSADRNGVLVFGDKADSERSEKWRQEQGLCNGGDY